MRKSEFAKGLRVEVRMPDGTVRAGTLGRQAITAQCWIVNLEGPIERTVVHQERIERAKGAS